MSPFGQLSVHRPQRSRSGPIRPKAETGPVRPVNPFQTATGSQPWPKAAWEQEKQSHHHRATQVSKASTLYNLLKLGDYSLRMIR